MTLNIIEVGAKQYFEGFSYNILHKNKLDGKSIVFFSYFSCLQLIKCDEVCNFKSNLHRFLCKYTRVKH